MNALDRIRRFRSDIVDNDEVASTARDAVQRRLRAQVQSPRKRWYTSLSSAGLSAAVLTLGGILVAVFVATPKDTNDPPAAVAPPATISIVQRDEVPVNTKIMTISPERARLARSILGRLGPYNKIARLDIGPARAITAHLDAGLTGRRRAEAGWAAHLVLEDLSRALIAAGWQPSTYGIADDYSLNAKPTPPAPTMFTDPAALARDLQSRATTGGFALREVVVLPVDGGAVRVTVQLREDQLLDPTAHDWFSTIITPDLSNHADRVCLVTEAPDGRVADLLCNGWNPTGDLATSPAPDTAIPTFWNGATRLDIVVTTTDFSKGGKQSTRSENLDCTTSPPSGSISDPPGLCARVVRDRWGLFAPIGQVTCSSPLGTPAVSVAGTLGGHAVDLTYTGCYGAVASRWIRALDNPKG